MWSLGGFKTTPQLATGEHRTVGGSNRTPRHTSPRGMGLTWLTTGPPRVGGDGSTLWGFWNKSALRADLRVFQRVGCLGLGCVVPRGPPTHASAGPWGAWIVGTSPHLLRSSDSLKEYEDAGPWGEWFLGVLNNTPQLAPAEHCTVGGSKRTLGRTPPRGVGLTWLTTGPSRVRGDGSTLWVFWNKSALRADLRVFLRIGCRGLGCVVPRGPPTHASAGPWGAWIVGTSPHLL